MKLWLLPVCAGIGGIEIGLRLVIPVRVLGYLEREAYAASVLLARMEDESLEPAPIFCGNLEDFDAREFAGVDLVTAGLPCQPYSAAGQQKGDEDERAIWPEFVRIVSECRSSMVFIENSPIFVTGGWFRRPGEELSRLGYRIEKPLFLAASDLGATHIRERVWVLAVRERNPIRFVTKRGQGAARQAESGNTFALDASEEVAHRDGGRCESKRFNGLRTARTPDAYGCGCADVADSNGAREETDVRENGERRLGSPIERAELGNTEQLDGRKGQIQPLSIQPPFPWPPGPSDWERWAEVGEALEPSFRRVVDGIPDKLGRQRNTVERLRCLGNAVVPQVAGFAFAYLAREAGLLE